MFEPGFSIPQEGNEHVWSLAPLCSGSPCARGLPQPGFLRMHPALEKLGYFFICAKSSSHQRRGENLGKGFPAGSPTTLDSKAGITGAAPRTLQKWLAAQYKAKSCASHSSSNLSLERGGNTTPAQERGCQAVASFRATLKSTALALQKALGPNCETKNTKVAVIGRRHIDTL